MYKLTRSKHGTHMLQFFHPQNIPYLLHHIGGQRMCPFTLMLSVCESHSQEEHPEPAPAHTPPGLHNTVVLSPSSSLPGPELPAKRTLVPLSQVLE